MNIKRFIGKIVPILVFLGTIIFLFLTTPAGLDKRLWEMGSAVCHQLPDHSFSLNGHQFPLCARCTGSFLSAFIAILFFLVQGKKSALPPKSIIILFSLFFVFWVVDGINSFSSETLNQQFLYTPGNLLRFLSGIGMGMVFALIILTIFNKVMWKESQDSALLENWRQMGLLLLCESPLLLFPFLRSDFLFTLAGFFSIAAVITLIALLYTILFVIISHQEGTYARFADVIFPLLIGFSIALLQMLFMRNVRQSLLPLSSYFHDYRFIGGLL